MSCTTIPGVLARRPRRLAAAAVLSVSSIVAWAAPSAASSCQTAWGSTAEAAGHLTSAPITGVRAGGHPCYDRLVIDLRGTTGTGFSVRYVTQVRGDSGSPTSLRGGAFLQITVGAPTYDTGGHPTYHPANPAEAVRVPGYRTFRQVALVSSFEGYTTLGLGVRARLPFRASVLPGPGSGARLVIDVAHSWS